MKFQRFETPGIAHYAYLVGDGTEAALVDPRRDVDEYLEAARALGVRIVYVVETHRQEDFVMGSAHLAERTGARIVNGAHDLFGHGDIRLEDGETIRVGGIELRALHTPGHTPESMSYAVHVPEGGDRAWGVLTGDALFFGDTGRTDLTDERRTRENAELLHDSVHRRIAPLGDSCVVLPAHGAGSVCGSGMAPLPFSTVGMERQYNAVFTLDRAAFGRKKAAERMPRPPYFRHMEEVNLEGGLPPVRRPADVALLSAEAIEEGRRKGTLLDTRGPEAFAGGHVPGSYGLWRGGLPVFGGWIASKDDDVYLITAEDAEVDGAVSHLARIGIDRIEGALAGGFSSWRRSGRLIETAGVTTPRELAEGRDGVQVLDVREAEEWEEGHIAEARHVYVGHLEERVGSLDLDRDRPVAVTCSIGNRSGLAVSILLRHGFRDVRNVLGGMTVWKRMELPTES